MRRLSWLAQNYFVKKIEQFLGTNISQTTEPFFSNLACKIVYMEGIKLYKFGTNQPSS